MVVELTGGRREDRWLGMFQNKPTARPHTSVFGVLHSFVQPSLITRVALTCFSKSVITAYSLHH